MASLIEELMPEPDVLMRHVRGVHAPPDQVFAAISRTDFGKSGLISMLFALRGIPALLMAPKETLEKLRKRKPDSALTLGYITEEGFGLVVLEALASGTPVVASRIAPFTEYLSNACSHWADPLSKHSIADAMLRASSGVRGERLRELASGLIDRMSWAASAERHIEIYRAFIDKVASINIPETHLAAA